MITLPYGQMHGERKQEFKNQMMVSSSFLLTNGEQIGLPFQSVITEMTGKNPHLKEAQNHSKAQDKAANG